jgi:toxin ParE1/3/4
MKGYILSPAAQADVEDIWDYTVKRWGLDQAEHYTRLIHTACEELAQGKRLSRSAEDVRPGYHRALAESHIIFFRRMDTGMINIIRILHQRMDIERHL